MAVTLRALLAWNTGALGEAADSIELLRRRTSSAVRDLERVSGRLGEQWEGEAAVAATATLRERAAEGERLDAALGSVERALRVAEDALASAQRAAREGQILAARHGLVIRDDGRCRVHREPPVPGDPAVLDFQRALAAAAEAQSLAAEALRRADEADLAADLALQRVRDTLAEIAVLDAVTVTPAAGPGPQGVPGADASPAEVAAWWASLTVAEQTALLRLRPEQIGNLDGVPLDVRVVANRAVIVDTLGSERARIADLEAQLADFRAHASEHRTGLATFRQLEADLADARARVAMYERLLTEDTTVWEGGRQSTVQGHQVLIFDPTGGRYAEVIGSLDATDLGVLVPGTGTNMLSMTGGGSEYTKGLSFVEAAQPRGSLAVISYLGGPMPQELVFAVDNSYALNQADELASFVDGVRTSSSATITVAGHSYGGSVVGAAEVAGMHADRVLHIESAGAGPYVTGIDDYAYPDTPRYSMTAPWDPIGAIQGLQLGGAGHGADPDTLAGVTRLETGYVIAGDPSSGRLEGLGAHSGVFEKGSTAWENILQVMTGGLVGVEVPPGLHLV